MPKLSVIVPIFNMEKYLGECLNSLVNQTFQDIEIICVDDGSTDNSAKIIEQYAAHCPKILLFKKENDGYGSACNYGLDKAKGEYIAIAEPDDYTDKNMYCSLISIAQKFESDVVKSAYFDNLDTKAVKRIKKVCKDDKLIPKERSFTLKECPVFLGQHPSIWSCIYKLSFLKENNIRFTEMPDEGWVDNLFQVQTLCLAKKINYTKNAYYYWRRTKEYDSDKLKDWRIPFKRSDEIHRWLEKENIKDKNILSCLYRREIMYANIVINKNVSKKEKYKIFSQIKKLIDRIDENALKTSRYGDGKIIKEFLSIKNHPKIHYFKSRLKTHLKKVRRKIIRSLNIFRWGLDE